MSGYLLDTDTCSHHFRGSQSVTERAANHAEELHLSTVTLAELLTWTLRTNAAPKWHRLLLRFLDAAQALHVTPEVAERCGQIRAEMYDQGHAVPIADMLIAATALVHNLTLVTHNTKHFAAVPGLMLEDWVTP
ncbi:MAG: type II toxin-antitoxin system VapC family toxin [Planctomycetota bacterium]